MQNLLKTGYGIILSYLLCQIDLYMRRIDITPIIQHYTTKSHTFYSVHCTIVNETIFSCFPDLILFGAAADGAAEGGSGLDGRGGRGGGAGGAGGQRAGAPSQIVLATNASQS